MAERLGDDQAVGIVKPHAAVLDRRRHTEEVHLAQLGNSSCAGKASISSRASICGLISRSVNRCSER